MTALTLHTGKDIIYKIRRRSDGLFSTGGSTPYFNKNGKIWKQKGHLTSHINQLQHGSGVTSYNYSHPHQTHVYEDCEIVTYRIAETEVGTNQTILEYVQERKKEKQIKEQKYEERQEERAKQAKRELYEELKKEFE